LAQELKRDKAMGSTDDWRLRRAAAQTLERLGVKAKAAAPALAAAMENDDYHVSQSAAKALLAMGPDAQAAIPTVILIVERKLTPTNEIKNSYMMQPHKAAEILGRIGPVAKSAIPALEQLAKDGKAEYRQAALDALQRIR
jgi:HEAT repeat protein